MIVGIPAVNADLEVKACEEGPVASAPSPPADIDVKEAEGKEREFKREEGLEGVKLTCACLKREERKGRSNGWMFGRRI